MRRCYRHRELLPAIGLVLSLVLAPASAQNSSPTSGIVFQWGPLRALRVPVSHGSLAEIQGKAEIDVALLRRSVKYRGVVPILVLKDGKRIQLAPVSIVTKPGPKLRAQALSILENLRSLSPFIQHQLVSPNPDNEGAGAPAVAGIVASDTVDHRSCQTPIRDQGEQRGTCTAFATTAAIEAFESCRNHRIVELSEEHAYHVFMQSTNCTCKRDCGATTYKTATYLTQHFVCTAAQLPYTPDIASLPENDATHVPAICSSASRYGFTAQGTQPILGTAYLPNPPSDLNANNPQYLESLLYSGYDVVYGLWIAGTAWSDGTAESGVIDVQMQNGQPSPTIGGHAMLLVGYDRPHSYFVFKNSWGSNHGHSGYFFVSYDYLRTYGKYGYVVTQVAD
jgi:hypothetical protein